MNPPKVKAKTKAKKVARVKRETGRPAPPGKDSAPPPADHRTKGNPPSDGEPPAKKRTRASSNRSRGSNTSHASENTHHDWPLAWNATTPGTKPETPTDRYVNPRQVAYEPSVINGKFYSVLNHTIKGTDKNGKPTWIDHMDMISLIADAIEECDNATDRPEIPSWITVGQLAAWLDKSDKLGDVDAYTVITKTLGFIAHYCTPHVHLGLYILAADTGDQMDVEDNNNEIFIASIPESWQAGKGNFDDFAEKWRLFGPRLPCSHSTSS